MAALDVYFDESRDNFRFKQLDIATGAILSPELADRIDEIEEVDATFDFDCLKKYKI
jgi:hypothetical protein